MSTTTPLPECHPARIENGGPGPRLELNAEASDLDIDGLLQQARDPRVPLSERLSLQDRLACLVDELCASCCAAELARARAGARDLWRALGDNWRNSLRPELATRCGIRLFHPGQLTPEQERALGRHLARRVWPLLTPLAVDQGHPFPALPDHGLSLAVVLIKSRRGIARRDVTLAIVSMPPGIPRLVELGLTSEGAKGFVLLDEAVAMHIGELFPGFRISSCCALRITRRRLPALGCSRRPNRGVAVRLEIAAGAPAEVEALLRAALHLEAPDVYRVDGPVGLDDLSKLRAYVDAPSA